MNYKITSPCTQDSEVKGEIKWVLLGFKPFQLYILVLFFFKISAFSQSNDTIFYNNKMADIITHEQALKGKIIISGMIKDSAMLEGIPFCYVIVTENNETISGGITDIEGKFRIETDISKIRGRSFDIKTSYFGYKTKIVKDIPKLNKDFVIDLKLSAQRNFIYCPIIHELGEPIFDKNSVPNGIKKER
jgi:hypothetical protein